MSFASETTVPIGRSQDQIKQMLTKYGATGFMFGEAAGQALCAFEANDRRIKIIVPMPPPPSSGATEASRRTFDQIQRTKWRCLHLVIKAKLEAIKSGVSTFENEWLAHIMMPNGRTIGQEMIPQIGEAYNSGKMPPLLRGHV